MPTISDPGAALVAAALAAGIEVTVLPGPSAVETALVASGLAGGRYAFLGFLPRRPGELRRLWQGLARWTWPVVAFESPKRLPGSLASLAAELPDREIAVCRELTKRFEEVVRGSAAALATRFDVPPKGEITLVVAGGTGEDVDAADDERRAAAAVSALVAAGTPRRVAVEVVAQLTGLSRNSLYRVSL